MFFSLDSNRPFDNFSRYLVLTVTASPDHHPNAGPRLWAHINLSGRINSTFKYMRRNNLKLEAPYFLLYHFVWIGAGTRMEHLFLEDGIFFTPLVFLQRFSHPLFFQDYISYPLNSDFSWNHFSHLTHVKIFTPLVFKVRDHSSRTSGGNQGFLYPLSRMSGLYNTIP